VPLEKIIDAVWPDEEGDLGRHAFETAIHRLRKLIGDPETIELKEGRVGFSRRRCWVDAWAFEEGANTQVPEADRIRAIRLYRGNLLADEDALPEAEPLRRRLRARFLDATEGLAAAFTERGDFEAALGLWRAAVAACPETEGAYLGLIRHQKALGYANEARETCRQLRASLEATGRVPSEATLSLMRALIN